MSELIDFVPCDDVRIEQGGKITLVGVYTDALLISPVQVGQPVYAKIILFIRARIDIRPLPERFAFRCLLDGLSIFETGNNLTGVTNPERPVTFLVGCGPVLIAKSGVMDFELSLLQDGKIVETLRPLGIPVSIGDVLAQPG